MDVPTPLVLASWVSGLAAHPDATFAAYIINGIRVGFRIGYDRRAICRPATTNMPTPHPQIVSDYLEREVRLERMSIVTSPDAKNLQISPLGLIPKKNRPNKWRLIVDLSSPHGASVNDRIDSEWASVSYTTVDLLAQVVLGAGKGSVLVKADVCEAYRMVPVHPRRQMVAGS